MSNDLWLFMHMDRYQTYGRKGLRHLTPEEAEFVIKKHQENKEARRG